jgi:hypothetical protein
MEVRAALQDRTNRSQVKRGPPLVDPESRPSAEKKARHNAKARGARCLIDELPDEVLVEILARLDVTDVCSWVRTCKQIGRCAAHPRVWRARALRLVRAPADAWCSMAPWFARIESLTVEPCAGAAEWALSSARPRGEGQLAVARQCHSPFCPLGEPLPGLPHLTHCGGLTDIGLALLAPMLPNVKAVSLVHMGHLTHASLLQIVRSCPLLERLDMSCCTAIEGPQDAPTEGPGLPESHAHLHSLDLSRTHISNAGLKRALELLPTLEKLSLNFCERYACARSRQWCRVRRADSLSPAHLIRLTAPAFAPSRAAPSKRRLDSRRPVEPSASTGGILSSHAALHGRLREVHIVGSDSIGRASMKLLKEQPQIKLSTDETFVDTYLQRAEGIRSDDLWALLSSYHQLSAGPAGPI